MSSARLYDYDGFYDDQDRKWRSKVGQIASALGMTVREVKDAIHEAKDDAGYGNDDNINVEVDVNSGDIRIGGQNGDVIGNVGDDGIGRSVAHAPGSPQIDWGPTVIVVIGGILITIGQIVSSPISAATG